MKKLILILPAIVLMGCGGNSLIREQDELYRVSMTQYQDYSCGQVRAEMRRLSRMIDEQTQSHAQKNDRNEYLSTALDALAIVSGAKPSSEMSKEEKAVLHRLKSQYNALDQLAIQKSCINETAQK